MFIVTADMPSTHKYVIERDVSMLQVKNSKDKSSKGSGKKKLAITDIAFHVEMGWANGKNSHRAMYRVDAGDIMIITIFEDTSGVYEQGRQYIANASGTLLDSSKKRSTKKVDGVEYFVYTYDNFYVYSSANEQFLVSK